MKKFLSFLCSLSLSDLKNSSAIFWEGGLSGGYQVLLLDVDQGWLLVGGKDHIYLLRPDSLDLPTRTVRHWHTGQSFSVRPATKKYVYATTFSLFCTSESDSSNCTELCFTLSDQVHWPAAREHVEHCRLAGKSLEVTRITQTKYQTRFPWSIYAAKYSSWCFVLRTTVPTLCGCCSPSIRPMFTPVVPVPIVHSVPTCTSDTTLR